MLGPALEPGQGGAGGLAGGGEGEDRFSALATPSTEQTGQAAFTSEPGDKLLLVAGCGQAGAWPCLGTRAG